jgi:hypothetical protein
LHFLQTVSNDDELQFFTHVEWSYNGGIWKNCCCTNLPKWKMKGNLPQSVYFITKFKFLPFEIFGFFKIFYLLKSSINHADAKYISRYKDTCKDAILICLKKFFLDIWMFLLYDSPIGKLKAVLTSSFTSESDLEDVLWDRPHISEG